jgi:hypothetical protein
MNIRTLNKALKDKGITNKEVTHFKGKYYLLHITQNNNPVPLIIDDNLADIKKEIDTYPTRK